MGGYNPGTDGWPRHRKSARVCACRAGSKRSPPGAAPVSRQRT